MMLATKSTGDPAEEQQARFICPYMGRAYALFAMPVEEKGDIFDPHPEEYEAFINTVMTAAKDF